MKYKYKETYNLSVMWSDILPRDGNLHKIADALYSKDGPVNICPKKLYGDGNCFYRALSYAMFGHEDKHIELRVKTVTEFVKNSKKCASRQLTTRCVLIPSVYNVLWRRQYRTGRLYRGIFSSWFRMKLSFQSNQVSIILWFIFRWCGVLNLIVLQKWQMLSKGFFICS